MHLYIIRLGVNTLMSRTPISYYLWFITGFVSFFAEKLLHLGPGWIGNTYHFSVTHLRGLGKSNFAEPTLPRYKTTVNDTTSILPLSSGDLFSNPGSEERFSLISSTVPDTGAYYYSHLRGPSKMIGTRTISDAALTLSTAPIWSNQNCHQFRSTGLDNDNPYPLVW